MSSINVVNFESVYTKVAGGKMTIVLSPKEFKILYREKTYGFNPVLGKQIVVDLMSGNIENLTDRFVFENEGHLLNFNMTEMILNSNLVAKVNEAMKVHRQGEKVHVHTEEKDIRVSTEVEKLVQEMEKMNMARLIEQSLSENNRAFFNECIVFAKKHSLL